VLQTLYENLIADGAYVYFLSGLGITLFITITGLLIGTIVGMVFCAMSLSRFRVLRVFARGYFLCMSGIPVILLLMLFYYVILAPAGTDAFMTSVIVFGLRSGALISEIMRSSLDSVDRGQILAARTLGFSKAGAFLHITLPQALQFGKGLYRHSAVTLLQDTSVVGYITVSDLTRVVNNMGSRTGNPLLSMVVGIVFYFLIAWVISLCFKTRKRRRQGGAGKNETFQTKAA
jgi:polar amino acid transport system permease protein/polar amino acid transport system substrate-binding protein